MTESFNRKLGRLAQSVSGTGSITSNAATASTWETARTLTLGGDLSGNVSIDGSQNVTLTATVAGNTVALGTDTTGDYVASVTAGTGITTTGTGEGAAVTVAIDNTVVTLSGSQTLTNKTLTTPVISSISNTGTLTLPTSTDTLVGRATTDTLTNKTIALGSNTVSGTLAEFNAAMIDADFTSLAGSETLTNKTISGVNNTLSNIGNSSLSNSSITINGTSVSLGGTRTLVTDDIAEDGSPVNLWYTDARTRSAISVTDAGGDGSLGYDSGTGVITYTGPSATEVRAHFSAGTGVTITTGQIAIGQSVGTTNDVTFAGVTADAVRVGVTTAGEIDTTTGNLTLDSAGGTTTIDDNATVTGNLQIDGNLTVSGTTVTMNTTTLSVEDNMIYLNSGSAVANPDLGFAGNYNDGTYRHAGLFRDASDGVFKFFHQYVPEPDASPYIDITHGTFALAPLQAASFTGSVTGNVTGNASTATAWQTARTLSLTGDVTGTSAAFDGSGNISITTTIAADSVALGTDTTGNYVASITNGNYLTGGNGGSEGATLTLAVDATSANTASKVVARDASGNFSAGTITATLSGNASTVTNGVYTTDTGTVTNTMLAGSIANNKLANSTISGISLGSNLATLTIGTGLSGTSYNGSTAVTIANTGVTSITGTANQVTASASTGGVTLSLPQNIHTGATPTFAGVVVGSGQGIYYDNSNYLIRPYDTSIAGGTLIYSAANSTIVADFDGTGTSEFFQVRAGAGTPNVLKLLSKTSGAGVNNSALTLNDNVIWNAANDGAGSGLDADLLDGQQGAYYAAASSLSSYLPLSGGTLTGGLTGTSASFSSTVTTAGYVVASATAMSFGRNIVSGTNLDTDLESGGTYSSYGSGGTSWNAPFSYGAVMAFEFTSGIRAQFGYDIRHNNSNYGNLWYRTKNNLGYSSWQVMLHTANYNSYSPTLTGTGASGTWGINVTGSAGSVSGNMSGAWAGNITWNSGVDISVPGESSFDVTSAGTWGVWDSTQGNYYIKCPGNGQVEIGAAASRGLYVYNLLNVVGGTAMTGGWNRTQILQATFPVLVMNSNNSKYAGMGYDYSGTTYGITFWTNGTSNNISGTGTEVLRLMNNSYVYVPIRLGLGTSSPNAMLHVGTEGISATEHTVSYGISRRNERETAVLRLGGGLAYVGWNHSFVTHPTTETNYTQIIKDNTSSYRASGISSSLSAFTLSADSYHVEWTGYLYVDTARTYYFNVNADDATDLFIDGKRVADYYNGHGAGNAGNRGGIWLDVGFHRLYTRFEEIGGGDEMTLQWSTDGGASYATIPSGNLYHGPEDCLFARGSSAGINVVGDVVATGNVTAYGSPSDISLKTNVKSIDNALSTVMNLRGVTFDWKEDSDAYQITKVKHDMGFIAQEVQQVLPDVVRMNPDGKLSLRDKTIIPLLVEAIKELKQDNEQLHRRIQQWEDNS